MVPEPKHDKIRMCEFYIMLGIVALKYKVIMQVFYPLWRILANMKQDKMKYLVFTVFKDKILLNILIEKSGILHLSKKWYQHSFSKFKINQERKKFFIFKFKIFSIL